MNVQFEPLPKTKVEKGEVFVFPICTAKISDIDKLDIEDYVKEQIAKKQRFFQNCSTLVVSRLKLFPKAKIKFHIHTKDYEWYIPLNTNKIRESFCTIGEGHSLENYTGDVIDVLSITIF